MTKEVDGVSYSVERIEFENTLSAGIQWRSLWKGQVPIFEEHQARLERGYSLEAWYALPYMERALVVAARRLDQASKGHQNDAEIAKMKRDSKAKK